MIISDDRQGFGEDEEKHIFKRFYKGKYGYTGPGPSISESIPEKHHGSIETRNPEKGAQFKLSFP